MLLSSRRRVLSFKHAVKSQNAQHVASTLLRNALVHLVHQLLCIVTTRSTDCARQDVGLQLMSKRRQDKQLRLDVWAPVSYSPRRFTSQRPGKMAVN